MNRVFVLSPANCNGVRARWLLRKRTAKKLASGIGPDCEVVLLGSLASRKYLKILSPIFGRRLIVPAEFIGRGDMSRGAYARENRELSCVDGTILTVRSTPSRTLFFAM